MLTVTKRRREPTARSADADRFATTPATTDAPRDAVGIAKTRTVTVDSVRIPIAKAPVDAAVIKREEALADYGALGDADVDAFADAQKRIVVTTDAAAISASKIAADAADAIRRGKVPTDDLGALDNKMGAGINADALAEVT